MTASASTAVMLCADDRDLVSGQILPDGGHCGVSGGRHPSGVDDVQASGVWRAGHDHARQSRPRRCPRGNPRWRRPEATPSRSRPAGIGRDQAWRRRRRECTPYRSVPGAVRARFLDHRYDSWKAPSIARAWHPGSGGDAGPQGSFPGAFSHEPGGARPGVDGRPRRWASMAWIDRARRGYGVIQSDRGSSRPLQITLPEMKTARSVSTWCRRSQDQGLVMQSVLSRRSSLPFQTLHRSAAPPDARGKGGEQPAARCSPAALQWQRLSEAG